MSVTGSPRNGAVRVVAVGDIDHETAPLLQACLCPQLSTRGDIDVVLDMRGVTFLNAGGLAVLATAADQATRAGITLGLCCNDRRSVMRPLSVTGLDHLLHLHPPGPHEPCGDAP